MNVMNVVQSDSGHGLRQSENTAEISKALLKVQSEMPIVSKGTSNTFFKSKYASLPDIWKILQPHLAINGLVVMQNQVGKREVIAERVVKPGKYDKEKVYHEFRETVFMVDFLTRITHVESGEWIESIGTFSTTEPDVQSDGSLITYARRYCLCPMLGVMVDDEDDDGNAASGRQHHETVQQPAVTTTSLLKTMLNKEAGCQNKEDANLVINHVVPGESLSSIENEATASAVMKAIRNGIDEKILDMSTVLEEARKQATAAESAAVFPV